MLPPFNWLVGGCTRDCWKNVEFSVGLYAFRNRAML
jgi:hypothetical protein